MRYRPRLLRPSVTAAIAIVSLCSIAAPAQAQQIPERLSMADAVRLAAERHPAMTEARARVDAMNADRLSADRRPNPVLSVDSEGYPVFDAPRSRYWPNQEFTIRLDQELETAGRRGLRLAQADGARDVAALELRDRARFLELDVKRAYLSAVLAQTDLRTAQAALETIDRVITLNRARLAQGEISGMELRRLQVERLRFVDDLFAAELALANTRGELLALLNAPALDLTPVLTDDLVAQPPEMSSLLELAASTATPPATLAARALEARPDVLAAREAQAVAETTTRLQRALRTPNVTIGGGYRSNFGANAVVFGAALPIPLFNRNDGGIARADAERRAADARTAAIEMRARLDVQRAVNAVTITRARVAYIEQEHLANAAQSRDVALESYRLGVADLIDFLDAQRAFRDTQRLYNRALYDQRVSLFELAAALALPGIQPQGVRP